MSGAEEWFGDEVGAVWQGQCMSLYARHLWAKTSSHVDAVAAPPERRQWAGGAAGGLCWWASHSQPLYPDNPSLLLSGRASHTQFAFSACCFRRLMRCKGVKDTTHVVCPPILKRVSSVICFCVEHVATRSCSLFSSYRKKLHCFH